MIDVEPAVPTAADGRRRRPWPLVAAVVASAVCFAGLAAWPAVRVGDGSEYVAMYLAWLETGRPFMTDASWSAYGRLYDGHTIAALLPASDLRSAFSTLPLGASADFSHFWLYSLVPATIARTLATFGIVVSPPAAFLLFHWVLVLVTIVVAWRFERIPGLLAIGVVVFCSPTVWYLDKVHTELFTICLTTCAVLAFLRGRWPIAGFFLAVASTQNISFVAIAAVVLLLDALARRGARRYRWDEALLLLVSCGAMLVHPAYYFFRLGVPTPQLLAGSAVIGAHVREFSIWFVDPDLGLLPNWPLGAAILATMFVRTPRAASAGPVATPEPTSRSIAIFVVAYLAVSLFAQSATMYINSGATPGVSRYALWYLALFVPLLVRWFRSLAPARSADRRRPDQGLRTAIAPLVVTSVTVAAGAVYAAVFFAPTIKEDGPRWGFLHPSWMSDLIQRRASWAYDPPVDVFVARFLTEPERRLVEAARFVVGPDCRKILVRPTPGTLRVGGRGCGLDADRLRDVLAERAMNERSEPFYVRLGDDELARARIVVEKDRWYAIGTAAGVLGDGWGSLEPWGVWSDAPRATLGVPCRRDDPRFPSSLDIAFRGFVAPGHEHVDLRFAVGDRMVANRRYAVGDASEAIVALPVTATDCRDGRLAVTIGIADPASPATLGLSNDQRSLGIGLMRFRLTTRDHA